MYYKVNGKLYTQSEMEVTALWKYVQHLDRGDKVVVTLDSIEYTIKVVPSPKFEMVLRNQFNYRFTPEVMGKHGYEALCNFLIYFPDASIQLRPSNTTHRFHWEEIESE